MHGTWHGWQTVAIDILYQRACPPNCKQNDVLFFGVCVFVEKLFLFTTWRHVGLVEVQLHSVLISTRWKWVAGFTPAENSAVPIDCAVSVTAIKLGLWVTSHVVELRRGDIVTHNMARHYVMMSLEMLLKAVHINRIG